jgi:hypothetical protein
MGMKFRPRLSDFNVTGAQAGTFPNAAGRPEKESDYWAAIERDLERQKRQQPKKGTGVPPSKTRKVGPVPLV